MRRARGFTLIEVMVALVIVALGLSALISTTVRVIGDSYTYRERALALYVGLNVITEMRLGDELPDLRETEEEIEFANTDWLYTARVVETELETLRRVEVDVALAETPDVIVRSVLGFVGNPRTSDDANLVWSGAGGNGGFGDRDAPDRRDGDEQPPPDPGEEP